MNTPLAILDLSEDTKTYISFCEDTKHTFRYRFANLKSQKE